MRPTNLCTHCRKKCDVRKPATDVLHKCKATDKLRPYRVTECRHYSADKYIN